MTRLVMRALFLFLVGSSALAETKVKFPLISQLNGHVELVLKNGEVRAAKRNEILREKVLLKTGVNSQLQVELGEGNSLVILENSEVQIPLIDLDTGETTEVHLRRGQIRVDSRDNNQRVYSTPVSHDVYTEAEFLLTYDISTAKAVMTCFRGVINFRGYEGETSARLAAGERAHFLGVLEGNSPSFDVLLKGRKVARGHLSSVESLPKSDFEKLQGLALVQRPVVPKKAKEALRQPGQICEKPFASLNECVWIFEGTQCVRRRCDANGIWSDSFKVPASAGKCQKKAVVSFCDY